MWEAPGGRRSALPKGGLDIRPELVREVVPVEAQLYGRPDPVGLAAYVVPLPLEPEPVEPALAAHQAHCVCELYLAALPGAGLLEELEDVRLEHISPDYREGRRG